MQTRSDMSRRHFLETAALAGGASEIEGEVGRAEQVPAGPGAELPVFGELLVASELEPEEIGVAAPGVLVDDVVARGREEVGPLGRLPVQQGGRV
mgnify:CR=1 FL=1